MGWPTTSAISCRRWRCPRQPEPWSLTSLREELIKIGAKVVSHGRYVMFQMAEVAVPRQMFRNILRLIRPPAPHRWRQHERGRHGNRADK
jgi:hypothetical protein